MADYVKEAVSFYKRIVKLIDEGKWGKDNIKVVIRNLLSNNEVELPSFIMEEALRRLVDAHFSYAISPDQLRFYIVFTDENGNEILKVDADFTDINFLLDEMKEGSLKNIVRVFIEDYYTRKIMKEEIKDIEKEYWGGVYHIIMDVIDGIIMGSEVPEISTDNPGIPWKIVLKRFDEYIPFSLVPISRNLVNQYYSFFGGSISKSLKPYKIVLEVNDVVGSSLDMKRILEKTGFPEIFKYFDYYSKMAEKIIKKVANLSKEEYLKLKGFEMKPGMEILDFYFSLNFLDVPSIQGLFGMRKVIFEKPVKINRTLEDIKGIEKINLAVRELFSAYAWKRLKDNIGFFSAQTHGVYASKEISPDELYYYHFLFPLVPVHKKIDKNKELVGTLRSVFITPFLDENNRIKYKIEVADYELIKEDADSGIFYSFNIIKDSIKILKEFYPQEIIENEKISKMFSTDVFPKFLLTLVYGSDIFDFDPRSYTLLKNLEEEVLRSKRSPLKQQALKRYLD